MPLPAGTWRPRVGLRPAGLGAGLSGLRMACRSQTLRPAGAPAHPGRFPAAFQHGCPTREAPAFLSCRPSVAGRAHRCCQACRRAWPGPREGGTQGRSRLPPAQRRHRSVQSPECCTGGLPRRGAGLAQEDSGGPPRLHCGPRPRRFAGRSPVGARLVPDGVRLAQNLCAGGGPALRHRGEGGPPEHNRPPEGRADVRNPLEVLGARGLQQGRPPSPAPGVGMD